MTMTTEAEIDADDTFLATGSGNSNNINNINISSNMEVFPSSVEEAGAMLGASITLYSMSSMMSSSSMASSSAGKQSGGGGSAAAAATTTGTSGSGSSGSGASSSSHSLPTGMHSSFSTVQPVPATRLLTRLYQLRALLRAASAPLVAAPSILAVLMKLLGISTSLSTPFMAAEHAPSSSVLMTTTTTTSTTASAASSSTSFTTTTTTTVGAGGQPQLQRPETPPMLSQAIRHLWVDCVVLCHARGQGLQGHAKIHSMAFLRQMLTLALLNPRSIKATGGVRIAALDVVAALLGYDYETSSNSSSRTPSAAASQVPSSASSSYGSISLSAQLAPWSLEVLQTSLKGLKSAGNGEPTYRLAAIQVASAAAVACRQAILLNTSSNSSNSNSEGEMNAAAKMIFPGALEEKATQEAVRILRQATQDKFPEVRREAAHLAALLAPLVITTAHSSISSSSGDGGHHSPLTVLEEILQIAWKNLDDDSLVVADAWAEAVARGLSVALYAQQAAAAETGSGSGGSSGGGASGSGGEPSDVDDIGTGDGGGGGGVKSAASSRSASPAPGGKRQGGRQHYFTGLAYPCTTTTRVLQLLVDHFVKVGGEMVANRLGGHFSTGGRAVRVGIGLVATKFCRLQACLSTSGSSSGGGGGRGGHFSVNPVTALILNFVGQEMDRQLKPPTNSSNNSASQELINSLPASALSSAAGPLFGTARSWSKGDGGLVRTITSRIIRQGLSEVMSEPLQLGLLQALVAKLPASAASTAAAGGGTTDAKSSAPPSPSSSSAAASSLNANQIQVALVEISHLVVTLGEAISSKAPDIMTHLRACLFHADMGVRHEAAIACVALSSLFLEEGRKLLLASVNQIKLDHEQLVQLAAKGVGGAHKTKAADEQPQSQSRGMLMFRRSFTSKEKQTDPTAPLQHSIHGHSLLVSILVRHMVGFPGGLPAKYLVTVLSVAETLVSCQFDDGLTSTNQAGACTCVRGGFSIISGVIATGPGAVAKHVPVAFAAWQKSVNITKTGGKYLAPRHDLFCIDSLLSSVVAFLKYCSELLLAIPEALSQITILLEEILPLLLSEGRLGSIPLTIPVASRLESARASLLEAFAWLPSGSFPMAADAVFGFAAEHIRAAVVGEVSCSILHNLVSAEDSLLDAKSLSRAKREGQVGGARDIEQTITVLTAEIASHGERESVLHLLDEDSRRKLDGSGHVFRGSHILGLYASHGKEKKPPTPLHEVGTWRRPIDPSCSSKVRLVDAAIQAFSATFGLRDGKEQQSAMDMLESLVPPYFAQLARALGVNAALTEQDRRTKNQENSAAVANITAVLLSCLQALPLHEATHNVPISLGPPWMNKAKDLLLTLLPSASNVVRRAAAEGLALLATLGVTEDAHFLQSTVLHSLDEVMQGNKPDGKARAIALESVSAARAGSLLTLACIQRTAYNVAQRQLARARGRVNSSRKAEEGKKSDDELPILQMMTRILPSIGFYGFKDYFVVRAYALHAFSVLLAYSSRLNSSTSLGQVEKQLLRKAVELVEDNFCASWMVASNDFDRGQEAEKMSSEVAFLAVLLRLMTFLIPSLHHLADEDSDIGRRFCLMARLILEAHGNHPTLTIEAMAFFEVFAGHQHLLPPPSSNVDYVENAIFSVIPFVLMSLTSDRPGIYARSARNGLPLVSPTTLRASTFLVRTLSLSGVSVVEWSDHRVVALLTASLESTCGGSRLCSSARFLRSLAAPREVEHAFSEGWDLEIEISQLLLMLLFLERSFHETDDGRYVRWALFSRMLLSSSTVEPVGDVAEYTRENVIQLANLRSAGDAAIVFNTSNPVRWQVKTIASQLATCALEETWKICQQSGKKHSDCPHFNFREAAKLCQQQCNVANDGGGRAPQSFLVFHLQELASAAIMSSAATRDHSELHTAQESSVHFLVQVIESFSKTPDPEISESSILEQYSQQIYSAIKHALSAPDEYHDEAALRLFVAGCNALVKTVEEELASDPMVLKRLLRPAVPDAKQVPFFSYEDGFPEDLLKADHDEDYGHNDSEHKNSRVSLLVQIAKISTTGRLLLERRSTIKSDALAPIVKELLDDDLDLAVHCAVVALDGARLLVGNHLSLAGQCRGKDDERGVSSSSGFLYENEADIDQAVKALLVKSWATCASSAMMPLLSAAAAEGSEEQVRDACLKWVERLSPLLASGIQDGIDMVKQTDQECPVPWARGLNPSDILLDCMDGLTVLVQLGKDLPLNSSWISGVLYLIRESVILPWLKEEKSFFDGQVIEVSCQLLQDLASSTCICDASTETALLVSLLTPLEFMSGEKDVLKKDATDRIISTCFNGLCSLIQRCKATDDMVQTFLEFVLQNVFANSVQYPESVQGPAKTLLRQCLNHASITLKDRRRSALDLAKSARWEAWAVVYGVDEGMAASQSLKVASAALSNVDNSVSQMAALAAVRSIAQSSAAPPSASIGRLMRIVGADVLGILYSYGTCSVPSNALAKRLTACADAMKTTLVTFQQISCEAASDDGPVVEFLSVFFEMLLAVMRFNGLPNHPSPQPQGDAALGRMSAQAILHTARTAPAPFKTCVADLAEHDRTLLEFAVRAEMTGYQVQSQHAPEKKKLNLQNFKK